MSSRDPLDHAAGGMAALVILIAAVVIAVTIWAAIKAVNLVLRVMVRHPRNKAMWVALGIALLSVTIAAAVGGTLLLADGLAAGGVAGLVTTARAVELYYDELLQPDLTKERLVNQVLYEPWWTMEAA